jgi:uncharacterized protein YndB with AHSA1/START domain
MADRSLIAKVRHFEAPRVRVFRILDTPDLIIESVEC